MKKTDTRQDVKKKRNSSFLSISLIVLALSLSIYYYYNHSSVGKETSRNEYQLLELFANDTMNFEISTTPLPISSASVILKSILKKDRNNIPKELDHLFGLKTVSVQSVRGYLNKKRFHKLKNQICSTPEQKTFCQEIVNRADPEFGLTPLHLAYQQGDEESISFLYSLGANKEAIDLVGRKPFNLSFQNFVSNSKKWAKELNRDCEIPIVDVKSIDDFKEVRRLIGEGEPVLMKGVLSHLSKGRELAEMSIASMVEDHGDSTVTMGPVPYSDVFNLPHKITTLKDYYIHHVLNKSSLPSYIFQKNDLVTESGLHVLGDLVSKAFPSPNLICPVEYGDTGSDSIHFFLGAKNSGAPFHIHADAANLVVKGSKRWLIYPPSQALYSGKHILEWVNEDFEQISVDKRPLECVQRSGDVIYIPFDWSHAILNLEDETFGYALELLNRREVMWSLPKFFRTC